MLKLNERGALTTRVLEDGRVIDLWQQLFNLKITISRDIDDDGWSDAWEYEELGAAIVAFTTWDPTTAPEPTGWYRNVASGRRRPGGDPAKEYVQD